MLLRHVDRHGRHNIKVGDHLKLPLNLPRPLSPDIEPPYRHGTFEVLAFPVRSNAPVQRREYDRGMAHCIVVRRLCDGWTTTIAAHYWTRLLEEYGL